jgi:acyl-homoserine lactone acylase PvdQ
MAPDGQNFRAVNAARLLSEAKDLSVDKMIHEVGYSRYLSAFDELIPALIKDYNALPQSDQSRKNLSEPIDSLKNWDKNSSASSVASTIAIEFGYRFLQKAPPSANPYDVTNAVGQLLATLQSTTSNDRLNLLEETLKDLEKRFGTWKIKWGEVNRYQRPSDGKFDDSKSSLPVGLAAATFGSLPSFASWRFSTTNKRYGVSGNSFVACVEFGKKIKAKSVITGGQSFDPSSKHYTDQAEMYINGNFKDILFYKDDVLRHVEKKYHPGEETIGNKQ